MYFTRVRRDVTRFIAINQACIFWQWILPYYTAMKTSKMYVVASANVCCDFLAKSDRVASQAVRFLSVCLQQCPVWRHAVDVRFENDAPRRVDTLTIYRTRKMKDFRKMNWSFEFGTCRSAARSSKTRIAASGCDKVTAGAPHWN